MAEAEIYYCKDCKNRFTLALYEQERETGEVLLKCGQCLNFNVVLVKSCIACGCLEYTEDLDDSFFCESCVIKLKEKFQALLGANFSAVEHRKLNDVYDGEVF